MLVLAKESWEADLKRAALSEFATKVVGQIVEYIISGKSKLPEILTEEVFERLVAEVPVFELSKRYYRIAHQGAHLNILRVGEEEARGSQLPYDFLRQQKDLKFAQIGKLLKVPEFPEGGLSVANTNCVSAAVTKHAWQRFCKRVPLKLVMGEGIDYFADLLKTAFGRSVPEKLKRGGEVRRTINNKFVPAHYFYDAATNLRFVISEDEPKTVITIEQRLI